jgi:hypothetical protein
MSIRELVGRALTGPYSGLLITCVAGVALAGWGAPRTAHGQGLVEQPFAFTPHVDCPNGCKWSLSILNSSARDFVVDELAIVIEPPLSDNLVTTLPRRMKDDTLDLTGTLLVCTATLDAQVRQRINVPMGEAVAVQIEVPPGHLVHSRILGEIGKLKEMPLLCWNAVDTKTGSELGSDCTDLRGARNVVPLAKGSLIPGNLCDGYPGGDCVCPFD